MGYEFYEVPRSIAEQAAIDAEMLGEPLAIFREEDGNFRVSIEEDVPQDGAIRWLYPCEVDMTPSTIHADTIADPDFDYIETLLRRAQRSMGALTGAYENRVNNERFPRHERVLATDAAEALRQAREEIEILVDFMKRCVGPCGDASDI